MRAFFIQIEATAVPHNNYQNVLNAMIPVATGY
jgi:hypothetical protein